MQQAELINIDNDFNYAVEKAVKIYNENRIFVYPTDTIYGIGGNPFSKVVTERIKQIKGRSEEQRFILLINSVENLKQYVDFADDSHPEFLSRIWPAPVSVILKLNNIYKDELGYEDSAFRIPDNKFCQTLLNKINQPIISTSVNRTGERALNDSEEIINKLGHGVDVIFYNNKNEGIIASTIIELKHKEPIIVREGEIKFKNLQKKLNRI